MKGWLLIQPYTEYLEATNQSDAEKPQTYILLKREAAAAATEGAAPVMFAIKYAINYPDSIKVFAENEGTQIGATFNTRDRDNVPGGNNGAYEIKGSPWESTGTFVNVAEKKETDFLKFFICHSKTPKGLHLRWEVGLDEISDGEIIGSI
jgi:hypothetical protein